MTRHVIAVLALAMLTACSSLETRESAGDWISDRLPTAKQRQVDADEQPVSPGNTSPTPGTSTEPVADIEVLQRGGSARMLGPERAQKGENGSPKSLRLDFVNADIRDVVRTVLGDMLGRSFTIGEQVNGAITLRSADLLSEQEALSLLGDVPRVKGYDIAEVGSVLVVSPRNARTQAAAKFEGADNIHVVSLYHLAAPTALELLQPLIGDQVALRPVSGRNGLLIAGSKRDLDYVLDLVSVLDVEQLRDKAIAIMNPRYASAVDVSQELELVFQGVGGQGFQPIRFSPLKRLNAVLVIAETQALLQQATTWMRKLDRSDSRGERSLRIYAVQNGRATDLAKVLSDLFASGSGSSPVTDASSQGAFQPRITADDRNNVLLVFANAAEMRSLQSALDKLDVPALQVLIEAVVAEVVLTDDLRYGVQWFFEEGDFSFTLSNQNTGAVANLFPGFSTLLSGSDIRATLSALENITEVRVVSSPRMMVVNNQTARLQVGDQVPIATQSAVERTDATSPIVNTIQFRDTGVILEVTPRVNQSGVVQLDIVQEISDVTATTTSDIDSPTIQQRKFSSSVSVSDGETIALGGLIRDRAEEGSSGVPVLSQIPVLGSLFGTDTRNQRRTEILVMITPRVVQSLDEIREVTNALRQELLRGALGPAQE